MPSAGKLIIRGITVGSKPFRPSDWADRLCGVTSAFGPENRLRYSPYVQPITIDGVKCVVVANELRHLEPRLFAFLVSFAQDNELELHREEKKEPVSGWV